MASIRSSHPSLGCRWLLHTHTYIHCVEWSCHIVKIPLNWNCFSLVLSVWIHVCVQRMICNNNSCYSRSAKLLLMEFGGLWLDESWIIGFWFSPFKGSRGFLEMLIIVMSCCKLCVLIRFNRLCETVEQHQASCSNSPGNFFHRQC